MKQAEKTKKTCDKILASAMIEFGQNGYEDTSLNIICSKYKISKGLVYHNFKSRDDLYLHVVEESFTKLITYLKENESDVGDAWEKMKKLLLLRQEFFSKFPNERNIFFSVVLTPPVHLLEELRKIKKEYDKFNIEKFKELLKTLKLREGITENMAITYFLTYQEIFNGYFQNQLYHQKDLFSVSKEHDLKLLPLLSVMLYGIAIDDSEKNRDKKEKILID